MPKLTAKKAKKVEKAQNEFKLIDAGLYTMNLAEVSTGEGPAGPYWRWDFQFPQGHENHPRKLGHFTSLSEESAFKMRETFEAFGVSSDTDTDDLIGKSVRVEVVQRTIQKGERMGELSNSINRVLPLDDDEDGGKKAKKGKGKKSKPDPDEPNF